MISITPNINRSDQVMQSDRKDQSYCDDSYSSTTSTCPTCNQVLPNITSYPVLAIQQVQLAPCPSKKLKQIDNCIYHFDENKPTNLPLALVQRGMKQPEEWVFLTPSESDDLKRSIPHLDEDINPDAFMMKPYGNQGRWIVCFGVDETPQAVKYFSKYQKVIQFLAEKVGSCVNTSDIFPNFKLHNNNNSNNNAINVEDKQEYISLTEASESETSPSNETNETNETNLISKQHVDNWYTLDVWVPCGQISMATIYRQQLCLGKIQCKGQFLLIK